MFFVAKLVKASKERRAKVKWPALKACIYKRR